MRGGAHQPAVEIARADQPIDHLGPDHPGVDDVRALGHQSGAVAQRQLRRGQAHVAPEADLQLVRGLAGEIGERARQAATDRLGGVAVDVVAIEAADVVGLEDPGEVGRWHVA